MLNNDIDNRIENANRLESFHLSFWHGFAETFVFLTWDSWKLCEDKNDLPNEG